MLLMALALPSCVSQRMVTVCNETKQPIFLTSSIEHRRDIEMPPGAQEKIPIIQRRGVELIPVLGQLRFDVTRGGAQDIHITGYDFFCLYDFPEGEKVRNQAWASRSMVSEALDSDAGRILFRGPKHVTWIRPDGVEYELKETVY